MSFESEAVQVVGVLAAMSAFLTGFNSVRAHGHRDRTFERLDRLYESILQNADATDAERDASLTPLLGELHDAAGEMITRWRLDVPAANLLLLVISILVFVATGISAGWSLAWPPSTELWLMLALLTAQLTLVIVMFTEGRFVRSQLVEKLRWLVIREPWSLMWTVDIDLAAVDRLMERALTATTKSRPKTAKRLVRAYLRRVRKTRDALEMVGRMYSDDFVAASPDIKQSREAAYALQKQLDWLRDSLDWFQRFLSVGVRGGLIEQPPKRP